MSVLAIREMISQLRGRRAPFVFMTVRQELIADRVADLLELMIEPEPVAIEAPRLRLAK